MQSRPQDFAKFFSGRCHATLGGAGDADGQRFGRAGKWAVEHAFASRDSVERNAQCDAVPGFHFNKDRTKGVAFYSRYRIGQSKGLNAQTFPLEGAAEALRDLVGSPSLWTGTPRDIARTLRPDSRTGNA
jgi:hypothetical protein